MLLQVYRAGAVKARLGSGAAQPHKADAKLPHPPQSTRSKTQAQHTNSMPSLNDSSSMVLLTKHELPNAELSEEELLQWQPAVPAMKQTGAELSVNARGQHGAKVQSSSAFADAREKLTAADASDRGSSSQLASASSTSLTNSSLSDDIGEDPISVQDTANTQRLLARPGQSTAVGGALIPGGALQISRPVPDMPSRQGVYGGSPPAACAVPAGPAQPCLSSLSSLTSTSHAVPSQHAPSTLPPQHALTEVLSPVRAPAAAAPSLTASIDSDWLAADAPEHRQSIMSWSSEASDIQALRHSAASTASVPNSDRSPITGLTSAEITGLGTVSSRRSAGSAPQQTVQWHLLNTEELQAQTAALLSSLTASTDWDQTNTEAPSLIQETLARTQSKGLVPEHAGTDSRMHVLPGALTLSQSHDLELLSSILDSIPSATAGVSGEQADAEAGSRGLLASGSRSASVRSARGTQDQEGKGRAFTRHSLASSLSSSGLSDQSPATGKESPADYHCYSKAVPWWTNAGTGKSLASTEPVPQQPHLSQSFDCTA